MLVSLVLGFKKEQGLGKRREFEIELSGMIVVHLVGG